MSQNLIFSLIFIQIYTKQLNIMAGATGFAIFKKVTYITCVERIVTVLFFACLNEMHLSFKFKDWMPFS